MIKLYTPVISDTDELLDKLRNQLEETNAQKQEREKYERLNTLRDNPERPENDNKIWSDF